MEGSPFGGPSIYFITMLAFYLFRACGKYTMMKPSNGASLGSNTSATGISADMLRLLGIKSVDPAPRRASQGDKHFNELARLLGVTLQKLTHANPKLQVDSYGNVTNGQIVQSGSGQSAYVLRAGEGFQNVARRLGISIHSLIDSNSHISDFAKLQAGDVLFFRSGGYDDPITNLAYQHSVSLPVFKACYEHVHDKKHVAGSLSLEATAEYLAEPITATLEFHRFLKCDGEPDALQQLILCPAEQPVSRLLVERLRAQIPYLTKAARDANIAHNNSLVICCFFDVYNQSAAAATNFLSRLDALALVDISQLSLTEMRVQSMVDTFNQQCEAGQTDNIYEQKARKRFGSNVTEAHIQQVIIQAEVPRVAQIRACID
jgi:LysM domain